MSKRRRARLRQWQRPLGRACPGEGGSSRRVTADLGAVLGADGLFVQGVATSTRAWRAAGGTGPAVDRSAAVRVLPVLGSASVQVLFEGSGEPTARPQEGLGSGRTRRAAHGAGRPLHMGGPRSTSGPAPGCSHGVETGASTSSTMPHTTGHCTPPPGFQAVAPIVTHATHGEPLRRRGVENGPLSAPSSTRRSPGGRPDAAGELDPITCDRWRPHDRPPRTAPRRRRP